MNVAGSLGARNPKRMRTFLGALIFAVLLGTIFVAGFADRSPEVLTAPSVAVAADVMDRGGIRSLPLGLYPAVLGALRQEVPPAYNIGREPESFIEGSNAIEGGPVSKARYQAVNPAQGLVTTFMSSGIRVAPFDGRNDTWTHGLRLTGYGYGDQIQSMPGASLVLEGPRIEYRYGVDESDLTSTVTEWYVNGPLGLEQGFTLMVPPPGAISSDPLQFILAYDGDLFPRLTPEGDVVGWADAEGREVLQYGGLFAFDATGAELPASMALSDEALVLRIEDAGAVYPIIVDPHFTSVELQPDPDAGTEQFAELGWSSAINGDGTTVIVGAPRDRTPVATDLGTAYVFVNNGGVWSQEQELQPVADGTNRPGDFFGWSVDISSDGNTAVVGAYFADCPVQFGGCGAAYVFVRNAGVWAQQGKLQQAVGDRPGDGANDDGSSDQYGYSVAISSDGLTIAVGARYDDEDGPNSGSVYVYDENAGAWPLNQKLLRFPVANFPVPSAPTLWGDIANFGISVSLDSDGHTLAIGAPGVPGPGAALNLADTGSVFIFSRNGAWAEEDELAPNVADLVFDMKFGHDVALSASGTTLVGGAPQGNQNNPSSGQAFVFEKIAGTWGQQQRLAPDVNTFAGAQCCERFGLSVATSDDGNTVLVGRDEDDISNALGLAGSAHVFVRRGGQWSNDHFLEQGGADFGQGDRFGTSVGVSGDGTGAVVGAPQDDDNSPTSGSAYVFGLNTGGTITIVKDTLPDNATDFPFGFFGGVLPAQIDFSLDDDADATLPDRRVFLLAPGEHFAFESIGGVAGWTLSNRACDDAGSSVVQGGLLSGIGVAIDLDAGEDITCTFTNTVQGAAIPGLTVWGLIGLAALLVAGFAWRLRPAIRQRTSAAG